MSQPTIALQDPAPQSSVEFTTSSKGVIQATVKVYHPDPDTAFRIACDLYRHAMEFARENGVQP